MRKAIEAARCSEWGGTVLHNRGYCEPKAWQSPGSGVDWEIDGRFIPRTATAILDPRVRGDDGLFPGCVGWA